MNTRWVDRVHPLRRRVVVGRRYDEGEGAHANCHRWPPSQHALLARRALMYLGPKGSYHVLIADTAHAQAVGEIPLSDAPRPIALSKDGNRLYANVDTLIGFEVADIPRRKVIHRVEAEVPEELLRKASRSHGIGLAAWRERALDVRRLPRPDLRV